MTNENVPQLNMTFLTANHREYATQFGDGLRILVKDDMPIEVITFDDIIAYNVIGRKYPGVRFEDYINHGYTADEIPEFIYVAALKIFCDALTTECGYPLHTLFIAGFPWDEAQKKLLVQCFPQATFFGLEQLHDQEIAPEYDDTCHKVLKFIGKVPLPAGSDTLRRRLHQQWNRSADQIAGKPCDCSVRRQSAGIEAMLSVSNGYPWEASQAHTVTENTCAA